MKTRYRQQKPFIGSVIAIILLFLLRAMVPAGFMPAALGSGSPVQLCPQGLTAQEVAVLLGEHHAHHHGEEAQAGEEFNCPLGLLLSAAALPSSFDNLTLENPVQTVPFAALVLFRVSPLRAFNSRAPPVYSA